MTAGLTERLRLLSAWLLFAALACWGTLAILFSNLPGGARHAAAAVFCLLALAAALVPRGNGAKMGWFSALFALVLGWWLLLPASNTRDWTPDLALLPSADIFASSVTIHNIRNCDYRTETDYTVRHYDRTFDLGALRSLDLFLVNWGLPHFSHAMLSFGFDGGEYVCISIETRKKKGDEYSAVKGFFKQYELTYVVADERDVVRLRTNYRKAEEVHLYRLKAAPALTRQIFLDYLRTVNILKDRPQWYNAILASCTTDIRKHIAPYYPKFKMDWRILASGHAEEMVYELGAVDRSLPLPELKRRSHINAHARAAGPDEAFSALIRRGLPGFAE